jgi:predicted dehydrogenase
VKACKSLEEVLANPEVDVIDICVPTPGHPSLTIAALKAGKHVICEKPMARTSALAKEMVAAAATAKGFAMPAMCLRFWPEWAWVKKAIDERTYGKVLSVFIRRLAEPPGWSKDTYMKGEASGGALLDLHIHDTDFIQFCFGRPRSVFSSGFTLFSGAIDHVVTQYQVDCGATVCAEGSWIMSSGHGFNMAYRVNFERATVSYDLARGAAALQVFEEGQPSRVVNCGGTDGYVNELRYFLNCVQQGKPPVTVTMQDGLSSVEICEAEEQSIKTGQVMTLK